MMSASKALAVATGLLASIVAASVVAAAPLAKPQVAAANASLRGLAVYHGHAVEFENADSWAIIEGDIILGRVDPGTRSATASRESAARAKGTVAVDNPSQLWPKAASGLFEVPSTIQAA